MSQISWQWDPARQDYYCWSAERGHYIDKDGSHFTPSNPQIEAEQPSPETKPPSPWQWDPVRKEYFAWSAGARYYVYQNGTPVDPSNRIDARPSDKAEQHDACSTAVGPGTYQDYSAPPDSSAMALMALGEASNNSSNFHRQQEQIPELGSVLSYGLDKTILTNFLCEKFGPLDFSVLFQDNVYTFQTPRALTEIERADLLDRRGIAGVSLGSSRENELSADDSNLDDRDPDDIMLGDSNPDDNYPDDSNPDDSDPDDSDPDNQNSDEDELPDLPQNNTWGGHFTQRLTVRSSKWAGKKFAWARFDSGADDGVNLVNLEKLKEWGADQSMMAPRGRQASQVDGKQLKYRGAIRLTWFLHPQSEWDDWFWVVKTMKYDMIISAKGTAMCWKYLKPKLAHIGLLTAAEEPLTRGELERRERERIAADRAREEARRAEIEAALKKKREEKRQLAGN